MQDIPIDDGLTHILDTVTMTFEEGPILTLGRCYICAAVPFPPSNENDRNLTLILGGAADLNHTEVIVARHKHLRNYVDLTEKEKQAKRKRSKRRKKTSATT